MARKPSLLHFLIWASSIPIAVSRYVGLDGDIASLVPSCAQSCLVSFIESNYPIEACKTDASLGCLCPTQSASGFTVGEAALQCLFGYIQVGLCDKKYGEGSSPASILNMCSGHANALPNTHPTLTATLVIPPSGSGAPSLLPPTSSRTTPLTSATTSRTTFSTRTSTSTRSVTSTSVSSSATTTMSDLKPQFKFKSEFDFKLISELNFRSGFFLHFEPDFHYYLKSDLDPSL
ncbi:hypothetical protein F4808DRAFT_94390 [Astrocystis sublimbata]|nr:hypothetical protein F4808DRAFT_94390 [Astrocystis sublimbata]